MADYRVQVISNGVTAEGVASTPSPIGVAPNPTRVINIAAPSITTGTPDITTSTLPDATKNSAYSVTLVAAGGVTPYTWSVIAGTIAPGLTLSSSGGLAGTPTTFGTYAFTVAVTDHSSQTATRSFTMNVVAGASSANYGSHIGDWMVQAGDQVLTLPDGTYDAAHLNIAASVHASTGGTYGGWLIIAAQNYLGAVVDLSALRFHLENTSPMKNLRIMFVGVKFINGETRINWLKYIRHWYCRWEFPPSVYLSQYTAAYQALHGGASPANLSVVDFNALDNMENAIGSSITQNQADSIEYYFCDFTKIYNDASDISATANPYFRGCRWWDVYNHNVQFKNPDGSTRAHSDNIATTSGAVTNLTNINFSGTHFDLEATNAGSTSITFNNGWVMAGDNIGIVGGSYWNNAGTSVISHLTGTIQNLKWCGMAQYQPSDQANPHYSVAQYGTYTVGGVTLAFNDKLLYGLEPDNSNHLGDVVFKEANGTTITLGTANTNWFFYPSGVTQPGSATASPGLISPDLTDSPIRPIETAIIPNHSSNPAVIDRAAHPYSSWAAFFASNWP